MTAVSPINKADTGPKDVVEQWLAAPRLHRVLGVLAVYYWLAFWFEIFRPGDISGIVMGMAVVGFWALVAIVYLTVPLFIESRTEPLILRIPFSSVEIDIPTQRAASQTAMYAAPAAIIEIIALATVAKGANWVCTLLATIGLLVFFRKLGAGRRAARKYALGEVVFAKMNNEQSDGGHVRPAIVAGYSGAWIALIPFTYEDQSLNPEYVQFDKEDWPGLEERNVYVHLTRIQLTKPERITYEAGEISESGGLKLTEGAEQLSAQLRHLVREELQEFVPRFDYEAHDIEVPIAFGDEEAMRSLNHTYARREDVQERQSINIFVGALFLTALSFVLHKVGAITFLLNHLDNRNPGEMVSGVASASWTVGIVWSLLVGAGAWAVLNWSDRIGTWIRDEVLGDLVVSNVDIRQALEGFWQKLGSRGHRILAAVGVGWVMAFTTSPSVTGCALFIAFTAAAYAALALND